MDCDNGKPHKNPVEIHYNTICSRKWSTGRHHIYPFKENMTSRKVPHLRFHASRDLSSLINSYMETMLKFLIYNYDVH